MDLDLDDDFLPKPVSTNGRTGRFKPKAKPNLSKKISDPVPSACTNDSKEKSVIAPPTESKKAQLIQPDEATTSNGKVNKSNLIENEEPLKNINDLNSQILPSKVLNTLDRENLTSQVVGSDNGLASTNADQFFPTDSAGKVDSLGNDMDLLDDIVFGQATRKVRACGKFKTTVKPRPKMNVIAEVIPDQSNAESAPPHDITSNGSLDPINSLSSTFKIVDSGTSLENSQQAIAYSNKSSGLTDYSSQLGLERQDEISMDVIWDSNLEGSSNKADSTGYVLDPFCDLLPEPTPSHVGAGRKFKPVVKPRSTKEASTKEKENHTKEPVVNCKDTSSREDADMLPETHSVPDFLVSQDSELCTGTVMSNISKDNNARFETEIDNNLRRKHLSDSNLSQEPSTSLEAGEPSRKHRRRIPSSSINENCDEEFLAVSSHNVVVDDNNNTNDGEYRVDTSPTKRKGKRKSKKVNDVNDESVKKPPKKFSHSTRRNKRRVDKVLLETPEDEIDYQKIPLKQLILLAETRERNESKEVANLAKQSTSQSVDNSSPQDGNDDSTYSNVQVNSGHFNYHSFMNRTRTVRWSKQDTEKFYEAVQQFGSDFSMIEQLFPDRTRKQIRLKFKKEERQHPLRLSEAVHSRPGTHSYFKQLMEQLQIAIVEPEEDGAEVLGEQNEAEEDVAPKSEEEETTKPKEEDNMEVDGEDAEEEDDDDEDDVDQSFSYRDMFG